MRYASICDGIGAAHVAAPKDWECAWVSEIEPFPSAVVAHHCGYKNLGDMTKIDLTDPDVRNVQLIVSGCPCQDFSIAGLRQSLDGNRGNLTLHCAKIVTDINPDYFVFENVPGILSTKDNAFGNFLATLVGEDAALVPEPLAQRTKYWRFDKRTNRWHTKWPDAGAVYGPEGSVAWRILDAQYFGLAQRRRRVFAVRCPRNGSDPAEILLEWGSVRRDTPPSRETRQENTGDTGSHSAGEVECSRERLDRTVAAYRTAGDGAVYDEGDRTAPITTATDQNTNIVHTFQNSAIGDSENPPIAQTPRVASGGAIANLVTHVFRMQSNCEFVADETASSVKARDYKQFTDIVVFDPTQITSKTNRSSPKTGDPCHTIAKGQHAPVIAIQERAVSQNPNTGPDGCGFQENLAYTCEARPSAQIVAFSSKDSGQDVSINITPTMRAMGHNKSHANAGGQLAVAYSIGQHAGTADGVACNDPIHPAGFGIKEEIASSVLSGNTQAVAMAFTQNQAGDVLTSHVMPSVGTNQNATGRNTPKIFKPDCFGIDNEQNVDRELFGCIRAHASGGCESAVMDSTQGRSIVRRLTCRETERLFGFEDDYTMIPTVVKKVSEKSLKKLSKKTGVSVDDLHQNLADYYRVTREHLRNVGVTPDSQRYRVLGNSMAIPVMRHILCKIQEDADRGFEL